MSDIGKRIESAFMRFKCDKLYAHDYHFMYKNILDDDVESILEIGVKQGNSLAAWRNILPKTKLYGVDITDKDFNNKLIPSDAKIFILDSTTEKSLEKIGVESFDIIIDDGNHFIENQIMTFNNFHKAFKKYYVIEDVYGENINYLIGYIKSIETFKKIEIFVSKQVLSMAAYQNFLKRHGRSVKIKTREEGMPLNMYAVIISK